MNRDDRIRTLAQVLLDAIWREVDGQDPLHQKNDTLIRYYRIAPYAKALEAAFDERDE